MKPKNLLTEYDLYMESQKKVIIDLKVLSLGNIYIQIGNQVTCIRSDNYDNTGDILYLDKPAEVPITKEVILNQLRRQHPSIEYIYYDAMYLDSESEFTQESMQLYTYTIQLLNVCKYEAEEFTDYINYNLLDYLTELTI